MLRERTASAYLSIIHSIVILLGHLAMTTGTVPGIIKEGSKKVLCISGWISSEKRDGVEPWGCFYCDCYYLLLLQLLI